MMWLMVALVGSTVALLVLASLPLWRLLTQHQCQGPGQHHYGPLYVILAPAHRLILFCHPCLQRRNHALKFYFLTLPTHKEDKTYDYRQDLRRSSPAP